MDKRSTEKKVSSQNALKRLLRSKPLHTELKFFKSYST